MTEEVQILPVYLRLECIFRYPKVLWVALKVFSMHLGGNPLRWVPLYS